MPPMNGKMTDKKPPKAPEMEPMDDQAMMDAMVKMDATKAETSGMGAPSPTSPYEVRTLDSLRDTINKFSDAFPGAPKVEWSYKPADGQVVGKGQWKDPIPPEMWGPTNAIIEAIKAVNTDGRFDDYAVDPMSATDDMGLRTLVSTLATALKDQDLMAALKAGPGGEEEAETEEPTTGGGETDEEIMSEVTKRMY